MRQWWKWLCGLLAVLLLAGVTLPAAAGEDPEPEVIQYPDSKFDPGPGWPEGWVPPEPPKELPEWHQAALEEWKKYIPELERVELRVMDPLPNWTKEYPYEWVADSVFCGKTAYIYYFPDLDREQLRKVTNKGYVVNYGNAEKPCQLAHISNISEIKEPPPEEYEVARRMDLLVEALDVARGGLGRCNEGVSGTTENIYVCLDDGDTRKVFDVPAYLDPEVGRVRVPIRFISELMGAEVTWDEATRTVTIAFPPMTRDVMKPVSLPGYTPADWFNPNASFPDAHRYTVEKQTVSTPAKQLVLTIGEPWAVVDGQRVAIDAPPVIRDERTMVPVRFVAEQLGAKVYWVGSEPIFKRGDKLVGTYHVHIFTPFYPLYDYPSWFLENRAVRF